MDFNVAPAGFQGWIEGSRVMAAVWAIVAVVVIFAVLNLLEYRRLD
jgi:hypothetical protein